MLTLLLCFAIAGITIQQADARWYHDGPGYEYGYGPYYGPYGYGYAPVADVGVGVGAAAEGVGAGVGNVLGGIFGN